MRGPAPRRQSRPCRQRDRCGALRRRRRRPRDARTSSRSTA